MIMTIFEEYFEAANSRIKVKIERHETDERRPARMQQNPKWNWVAEYDGEEFTGIVTALGEPENRSERFDFDWDHDMDVLPENHEDIEAAVEKEIKK